jgi:hypothetical protein
VVPLDGKIAGCDLLSEFGVPLAKRGLRGEPWKNFY